MAKAADHKKLQEEIEELKSQLFESNSIIDAIKDGDIDALVLSTEGKPNVYAIESADYTYRMLIEKFTEGALSISENGLILFCNKMFSKMVGTDSDKIIGTYFNSFIDSVGQFHDLKKELKQGHSKGEVVLNINGKKMPVMMSLTDLKPQVNAIGIIVTDLSNKIKHEETIELYQKKLELKIQELNNSNEFLEQFIHAISHNIKEPLRKIVSHSAQLHHTTENIMDQQESENLSTISKSALRLTALVDNLMNYSLTSDKTENEVVDLNTVIEEVIDDLEISFKENGAELKFKDLPRVNGSTVQIRQLFSNLIQHSLSHKKNGTNHSIFLTSDITDCVDANFPNKKYYRISFSDTGTVQKTDQLKKLFIFSHKSQAPNSYFGNGIGLAICKKIMETHKGKIQAINSPSQGTIIQMFFPV